MFTLENEDRMMLDLKEHFDILLQVWGLGSVCVGFSGSNRATRTLILGILKGNYSFTYLNGLTPYHTSHSNGFPILFWIRHSF